MRSMAHCLSGITAAIKHRRNGWRKIFAVKKKAVTKWRVAGYDPKLTTQDMLKRMQGITPGC